MKNLIGDEWKDSSNSLKIDVINPFDNEVIDTIPNSTVDDVISAVSSCKDSMEEWKNIPIYKKCQIMTKFSQLLIDNKEDIIKSLVLESGKTYRESSHEFNLLIEDLDQVINSAKVLSNVTPLPGTNRFNTTSIQISKREPLGIVGVLLSHNMNLRLFATKIVSPLIMGNVVIVKPSKKTPLTISNLVYLLTQAGVVRGAIELIHGDGKVIGQALSMHPDINLISFTGSTANGIRVASAASKNVTKMLLDLSGNNSFIVCTDADIDLAVNEAIIGRLYHAGQVSNANKVFYVNTNVKDEFVQKLVAKCKSLNIGNPLNKDTDCGCLINEKRAERVQKQIEDLVNEGAIIEYGGRRDGSFVEPTILTNISPTMSITTNLDILGPVIPIIEYTNLDSVVEVVNQSVYGSGASIFTNNSSLMFKISELLEVGTIVFNGSTINDIHLNNIEKWKYSGLGKEGIISSLEECTKVKNIILDKILE